MLIGVNKKEKNLFLTVSCDGSFAILHGPTHIMGYVPETIRAYRQGKVVLTPNDQCTIFNDEEMRDSICTIKTYEDDRCTIELHQPGFIHVKGLGVTEITA